jgi:hypothetical protein
MNSTRRCYSISLLTCIGCFLVPDVEAQFSWRRTYGGFDANIGRSVQQTSDGGYIIAGSTGSFGGGGDTYVVKLDPDGLIVWSTLVGDGGVQTGVACREIDGGYMVSGTTSTGSFGGYDLLLAKVSIDGILLWERSYGTMGWEICGGLEVAADGFYLIGTTYISGDGDVLLIRTDLNGDTLWTRTFGGQYDDLGNGGAMTSNGDIVIAGGISNTALDRDAWIGKWTNNGALIWSTVFGGDSLDQFYDAVETSDGGFAASGMTESYSDVRQILLLKLNAAGSEIWHQAFGSFGDSEGREIQENSQSELVVASYNSYGNAGGRDMVLFKTAEEGDFLLGKNYGGLDNEEGFSLACTVDGGYIIVGTADGYGPGSRSIFVVKAGADGETQDDTVYEMFDDIGVFETYHPAFVIFPNPASTTCSITGSEQLRSVELFDTQGRLQRSWTFPIPTSLELQGLPDGLYTLMTIDDRGARQASPLMIQNQ